MDHFNAQTTEILNFVATTLTGFGATTMASNTKEGTVLLLLGAFVFLVRGFYKKYLEDQK